MPLPSARTLGENAVAPDVDVGSGTAAVAADEIESDYDSDHGHTPEAAEVDRVKARLSELRTRECELDGELSEALAVVERVRAKRDAERCAPRWH